MGLDSLRNQALSLLCAFLSPKSGILSAMEMLQLRQFSCWLVSLLQWVADFPVQAEGIDNASDAPAMSFADGIDWPCASFQGAGEHFIRIRNSEDQSNRFSTDRSGNRAGAIWRFLA